MVKEIKKDGKKYYQCEEYLMYYLDKNIAKKCEVFCKKNKACNLDLIKHAVELDNKNTCDVDCKDEGKSKCC
jgi:hypothetical protein